MAGGGLRGSQKVKGGATGSASTMTAKPAGAPSVRDAIRSAKIGGQATTVTGRVAKHVNLPGKRGKGTY
jgi:hypothetical protein